MKERTRGVGTAGTQGEGRKGRRAEGARGGEGGMRERGEGREEQREVGRGGRWKHFALCRPFEAEGDVGRALKGLLKGVREVALMMEGGGGGGEAGEVHRKVLCGLWGPRGTAEHGHEVAVRAGGSDNALQLSAGDSRAAADGRPLHGQQAPPPRRPSVTPRDAKRTPN